MTVSMVGTGCWINGEPVGAWQVQQDQQMQVVWSNSPRPDPSWSFTDTVGHFHAHSSGDKRYPTLRTRVEVVPCHDPEHDEDCDGANVTHWHCRLCDEEVTPGLLHGEHSISIPGLRSWEVRVTLPAERAMALNNQHVSVRGQAGETEMFGVAIAYVRSVSSDDIARDAVTVSLVGVGPLGRRKP